MTLFRHQRGDYEDLWWIDHGKERYRVHYHRDRDQWFIKGSRHGYHREFDRVYESWPLFIQLVAFTRLLPEHPIYPID
jgi:hypothetical protein